MSSKKMLRAILRARLSPFIERSFYELSPGKTYLHNWHIDAIAHQLELVRAGVTRRLIINLQARVLKSHSVSVAFPAWILGHDPTARIVSICYSDLLVGKFSRDTRILMDSRFYRETFPSTRLGPGKVAEGEISTSRLGYRLAVSINGTLTGRGGDLLIIDDPLQPEEAMSDSRRTTVNDLYDSTIYSRLDDKNTGSIVIVMQRLHTDDLVGHLLGKSEHWEVLSIPAIAPVDQIYDCGSYRYARRAGEPLHGARHSIELLEQEKADRGSFVFAAQFQQAPVPLEGNLFKFEWLSRYSQRPTAQDVRQIVQSWDTASKLGKNNDFSVCTTWAITSDRYFLLDVVRGRWEFPDLCREAVARARDHAARVILIEDADAGRALIQSLRGKSQLNVIGAKPEHSKEARALQAAAVVASDRVLLPKDAPWMADLLGELLAFPAGRYCDQVDSISQFLNWAEKYQRRWTPDFICPPRIIYG
jgi:predicted phage terminase large subunit-like protein